MSIERPSTPPRTSEYNEIPITPEKVRLIEINRLKAKARQREKEQAAYASTSSNETNANKKRPLAVIPAESLSPTGAIPSKEREKPLKRDSRLGKYFEYDLSKMINSKGGFLVEDGKEVNEAERMKEKERENQRAMQSLEPPVNIELDKNPTCPECNSSIDLDQQYKRIFGVLVCNKCKNEKPEKYSLLTKTECKEDYLLTDPELKDYEELPHILKANPHKSTWNNMMLYLRLQVEAFAIRKWGSLEALDTEFERRESEKKKKKGKKFEEGLKELRKRTRETVWQKRRDEEHKHEFSEVVIAGERGEGVQTCRTCGFEVEVEVL